MLKNLYSLATTTVKFRWRRRPSVQAVNSTPIDYLLNDSTTPDLRKQIDPLPAPYLPIVVKDYEGGGFDVNSNQFHAAQCYTTIVNTLNLCSKLTDKRLDKWAGTKSLLILPAAGADLNAYYDRISLRFFYLDQVKIGSIYTADSADIVAHELGHAILDSYRPDTWSAASLEVWSFHEAFADLTAILNILSHQEVMTRVLCETNSDLRKSNIVSNLAEHVGSAIYKLAGDPTRKSYCLRSAINDFKYIDPALLPSAASDDKLAAECHSFGRVFLGAFYDILVMIFEEERQHHDAITALSMARDTLGQYVLKAIQNAPLNARFYESMAKTILWADVTINNWKYHNKMYDIFVARNILTHEVKALSAAPPCKSSKCIMKVDKKLKLKLSDHLLRAQDSTNTLYDVEIEVPDGSAYLYDNDKQVLDVISASPEQVLTSSKTFIEYLHESKQVGNDDRTPFAVQKGKLIRSHFA